MNGTSKTKALTIRDWIHEPDTVRQLEATLPKWLNAERFLRVFYTAILRNEKLLECDKRSILSAMIESAQLRLEPIMGKAALTPYGKECQFQPMYRALVDLARRTGNVKVTAHVVYEKDELDVEYGTEDRISHRPHLNGDRGRMIGAYTVWTWESGYQSFTYMMREQIEQIRNRYSKSWKNSGEKSVWRTSPGEMFKKTVIKRHTKLEPCSIEMERAVELDNLAEIGRTQVGLPPLKDLVSGPSVTEEAQGEPETVEGEGEPGEPGESEWAAFTQAAARKGISHANVAQWATEKAKEYGTSYNTVMAQASDERLMDKALESLEKWYADKRPPGSGKPKAPSAKEDPRRKQFIKLTQAGYSTWVYSHIEEIKPWPSNLLSEMRKKWYRFYPGQKFPLDPNGDPTPPPGMMDQGPQQEAPPLTEAPPEMAENQGQGPQGEDFSHEPIPEKATEKEIADPSGSEEAENYMTPWEFGGKVKDAIGILGDVKVLEIFHRHNNTRSDSTDVPKGKRVAVWRDIKSAIDQANQ